MFQAKRWLEDPRFFSPMADTPAGYVYVHDFVQCQTGNDWIHGRVYQFYCKVPFLVFLSTNA